MGLLTGKLSPDGARAGGMIQVEGDEEALYHFLALCRLPAADEPRD